MIVLNDEIMKYLPRINCVKTQTPFVPSVPLNGTTTKLGGEGKRLEIIKNGFQISYQDSSAHII